jgi:hypothetical protein
MTRNALLVTGHFRVGTSSEMFQSRFFTHSVEGARMRDRPANGSNSDGSKWKMTRTSSERKKIVTNAETGSFRAPEYRTNVQ